MYEKINNSGTYDLFLYNWDSMHLWTLIFPYLKKLL